MIQRGVATFGLDYGKCPSWLFERMKKLGREIINVMVKEYGPDEFVKRIADPVWFQSLGTVLAFDWNSSGLTTILTAALKEAIRGSEKDLGIFICGGKGKTSQKTPVEIESWGDVLGLPVPGVDNLVYNSKMAAKVDSTLIQDGFQIYHHAFFFSLRQAQGKLLRQAQGKLLRQAQGRPKIGNWAVVQQGMNINNRSARRYHWYSEKINDLVCEPHSGIASQFKVPTLNLAARESKDNQKVSTELVQAGYPGLMKDIQVLRKHSSELSQVLALRFKKEKAVFLHLENKEFCWHPLLTEDFSKSKYLEKILSRLCAEKPENYEKLLSLSGVGPKTIRALSLVSEIIYGARPSYEDPARYSFALGGKDATPYPVDRQTYDSTINFFRDLIQKAKIPLFEKNRMFDNLEFGCRIKQCADKQ